MHQKYFLLISRKLYLQQQQIRINYKVEKMKKECVLLLLLLFIVSANMAELSQPFPVIGVITLTYRRTDLSYVNEMYVKFVEMYGGQVVPVYAFSSTQALRELLAKINGVIFPGGSMNIYVESKWRENVEVIFNYAIEQNDQGNTFPILGTCLGLQLMAYFTVGKNDSIMTRLLGGDHDQIHPLIFTDEQSDFYQYFTPEQRKLASTEKGIFYFSHSYGLTPEKYEGNQKLKAFFKVTAWAKTAQNETFAASIEARNYPFYGFHFHPQTTLSQWHRFLIRNKQSIEAARIFPALLSEKAKTNKNRFQSIEEFMEKSIDNFEGTFNPRHKLDSTVIYLFDEKQGLEDQEQ